jgi:hypothetical protein
MLRWLLVQNRQGKSRLSKFYVPLDDDEKVRLKGEVHRLIAPRDQKYQSNFVEVSLVDGLEGMEWCCPLTLLSSDYL